MPSNAQASIRRAFHRMAPTGRRSVKSRGPIDRAAIARIAKQVFNRSVEHKSFPFANGHTVTTTADVDCLSLVPQGDTVITRDGDALSASTLLFRCRATSGVTSGSAKQNLRMVIVQWNGDTTLNPPTSALIFEDATNLSYSTLKHDSFPQMKVLADEVFLLDLYHAA